MDSTQSTPDAAASKQYDPDNHQADDDAGRLDPVTTYTIVEASGNEYDTMDPDLAETWSRAGLRVTAVTEGQR